MHKGKKYQEVFFNSFIIFFACHCAWCHVASNFERYRNMYFGETNGLIDWLYGTRSVDSLLLYFHIAFISILYQYCTFISTRLLRFSSQINVVSCFPPHVVFTCLLRFRLDMQKLSAIASSIIAGNIKAVCKKTVCTNVPTLLPGIPGTFIKQLIKHTHSQ